MAWKDIAEIVGRSAPMLGGLLAGKAGAGIGSIIASALGVGNDPDEVAQALSISPEAAVKLKEIESTRQVELQRLIVADEANRLEAEAKAVQSVNTTMQAEAASEHWPTYGWRPAIGFSVAFAICLSVLTVFAAYGASIFAQKSEGLQHLPGILAAIMGIIGVASPILGIASFFRGKMQASPTVPSDNRG